MLKKLPAAMHWFSNTGPKFIEKRRAGLQQYLNDIVQPGSDLASVQEVADFLGVSNTRGVAMSA